MIAPILLLFSMLGLGLPILGPEGWTYASHEREWQDLLP